MATLRLQTRRIQRTGARGYGLNLPVVWIRHCGLLEGDELSIEVGDDNRLIITPLRTREEPA